MSKVRSREIIMKLSKKWGKKINQSSYEKNNLHKKIKQATQEIKINYTW